MQNILVIGCAFLLVACTNPWKDHYQAAPAAAVVGGVRAAASVGAPPQVLVGEDPERDGLEMLRSGHWLIGTTSFQAQEGRVSVMDLKAYAWELGANAVLFYSNYAGTHTTLIPIRVPIETTATTRHSGSARGSGGYGTYSGTSETTTRSTEVHSVPYSVRMHNHAATYWVELEPGPLGVHVTDLTWELRREIERNRGAVVRIVLNDSPAFGADILEGDVVVAVSGREVRDAHEFREVIGAMAGQEVIVDLLRGGRTVSKRVQLRSPRE